MMQAVRRGLARILLADDNEAERGSIIQALGEETFDFLEADRGLAAVSIARRERVDLTILDMNMPDISGLETLRLIREFRAAVPCIMVSGMRTKELTAQALDEGAFTMLDKPLSVTILRYTVQLIIER